MKILEIMADIQSRLSVPKGQMNKFGNYKYRSCEDIVEAVKPLLAEHTATLNITDEMVQLGDRYYVKATAVIACGTEFATASAYAREPLTKKGMDEAQITGATSSYARKYALNGLLAIDDTKDADSNEQRQAVEKKVSKETSIDGEDIDPNRLQDVVNEAVAIVDSDDMDFGPMAAKKLYAPLNKTERQYIQGKLRELTFINQETQRPNQYWVGFKAYLEAAV